MAASEFKILSIDGGGFKGLYSACLLSEIERANGALSEHFDMLCGTSTGGLIALGLAAGKSASEMVQFYQEWGPRIFPPVGKIGQIRRFLRLLSCKSRYDNAALTEAARSVLGELRMQEANSYLCIPSFNTTRSQPRVFKTDHNPSLSRDADLLMWQVALATAAAPTYFPIATCAESQGNAHYIDGGIWANNPSLVGLTEACSCFAGSNKPFNSIRILSVGTVSPAPGRVAIDRYADSVLGFGGELLEAVMESQQRATDNFIKFLVPVLEVPVTYVRIPGQTLSAPQMKVVTLDRADTLASNTLMELGCTTGHEWKSRPDVKAFFNESVVKPHFTSRNPN